MTQSTRRILSSLRSLFNKPPAPSLHTTTTKNSSSRSFRRVATAAASIATAAGLVTFSPFVRVTEAKALFRSDPEPDVEPLVKKPALVFNFLADVVERTAPAVVKIEIPIFNRFFREAIGTAAGSGFLISEDGLILTNAHVVGNSHKCKVFMYDGRELEGTVEAVDERADLATVKIPGRNLPTIRLGSSSGTRAGEFVVALGSPMHLSNSISHGIISSTHRRLDDITGGQVPTSMPYLQTDAAINIGNSGGPLVNLEGQAIGVNTMKLAEGIAFAIPMDYVKLFLAKVAEKKSVKRLPQQQPVAQIPIEQRRGFVGLTMLQLNQRIADQMRSNNPDFPHVESGILVMKVVEGSPAHQSGLQPNDVILQVNGQAVKDSRVLLSAIRDNNEIVLDIKRGSKDLTLTILPQEHNVLVFSLEG